ncbi:MAG: FtsX-like permease family protein [Rhodothermales bacterium]
MNNASLRQATHTMAIGLRTQHIPLMLVRLRAGAISEGIEALSSVWNDFVSARPFKYSLVDDQIAAQYTSDKRLGRLFTLFSSIAIFIACLGLFGLASFSAEQRTKEIGIRKVLGAGVAQIAGLFTKEYTLLVLFAVLASTPIAYLAIQSWLDQFAYHIPVRPWLFLGTMAITLIIALASVIYQAILAALADPVESLRYE